MRSLRIQRWTAVNGSLPSHCSTVLRTVLCRFIDIVLIHSFHEILNSGRLAAFPSAIVRLDVDLRSVGSPHEILFHFLAFLRYPSFPALHPRLDGIIITFSPPTRSETREGRFNYFIAWPPTATSTLFSSCAPLFFGASRNWISRYANVTDVSLNIVPTMPFSFELQTLRSDVAFVQRTMANNPSNRTSLEWWKESEKYQWQDWSLLQLLYVKSTIHSE